MRPTGGIRRRFLLASLGAISGGLGALGSLVVLIQGGHLDPGLSQLLLTVGVVIGVAMALTEIPKPVERTLAYVLVLLTLAMFVFGAGPAQAQEACRVTITGAGAATSLADTAETRPLVIDFSSADRLTLTAKADDGVTGTVEVSVLSVRPFGFLTEPGDAVLFYSAITDGEASSFITLEKAGVTGFIARGDNFETPFLPFGLVELDIVVRETSGLEPREVCRHNAWIRIVATPATNSTGLIGLATSAAGLLGLASLGPLRRRLLPPSLMIAVTNIPAAGPHAPYVESRFVDERGNPVQVDQPLVALQKYSLRLTVQPGSGARLGTPTALHATISGTAFDALERVVTVETSGEPLSMDIPIRPRQSGRHEAVIDLTTAGHLLQTERITVSVVADERDPREHRSQTTRTVFSASDLSPTDLAQRPKRGLVVILEHDPKDGSVDARVLDHNGKRIVVFDTSVQPEALTNAATIARTQLQKALEEGPGRIRHSDPADLAARLLPLVKVGRTLHGALFARESVVEGDPIEVSSLTTEGAIVQIVQNRAGLGFSTLPWQFVYDHPFIARATKNRLCPTFREHPVDRCPDQADPNVFCPTGFWGYRAVIEEPWVVMDPQQLDPPTQISDAAAVAGELGASYFLPQLSFSPVGRRVLTEKGIRQITDLDDLMVFVENEAGRLRLLYFYTHHARDEHDQTQGILVGEDLLSAGTLEALPAHWGRRPLVIVNGCASGDYSLIDPVSLLDKFRHKGACGVVTTECTMWDRLAGELGAEIVEALLAGKQLGPVLLEMRRSLLTAHSNPVGMAYRMHAMSETTVRLAPTDTFHVDLTTQDARSEITR